jgi:hypothetical protein
MTEIRNPLTTFVVSDEGEVIYTMIGEEGDTADVSFNNTDSLRKHAGAFLLGEHAINVFNEHGFEAAAEFLDEYHEDTTLNDNDLNELLDGDGG